MMLTDKKEIVICGTGKVAYHLGSYLNQIGHDLLGVWGRDVEKCAELSKKLHTSVISDLFNLSNTSIVIVCVSDIAISKVLSSIPKHVKIAYTSGSIKLEDLPARENLGVFYPLQTFSEEKEVDISKVPFLIEATNPIFEQELIGLAQTLSDNVQKTNSRERFLIHVGAVMVNNFTNFLYYLAEKHLKEHELDFKVLKPLIMETAEKLQTLTPREAQTGPAVRGDNKIIEQHIQSISDADTRELYKLMSELIIKEFNKDEL